MKDHNLHLYNSLTRKKEKFEPMKSPNVGLYVCGPTVYGDPHLGHARPYITFDVLFRYLRFLGYKVRYVRNITDVGHLVNDADAGEDKIGKKAKLESLEPMEVVQMYSNSFHRAMDKLNNISPSIEPSASGHIPEQIHMVQEILDAGLAYESNGSVYFDVLKYAETEDYGSLSGRVLEDLIANSDRDEEGRQLEGQQEKRNPLDFAIWKKANPEHIMRWSSPWSDGFPGWHLECSVMSRKYLGFPFDIHGGGMDLQFPHHECEIAQGKAATGQNPVRYWMHNNMITIQGKKMGKSYNNFITLSEFFAGEHDKLEQAYTPMCVRFYILMAHYRSTLDFSNEALQSSYKAYLRLINGIKLSRELSAGVKDSLDIGKWIADCMAVMDDDLNTAQLIALLFDGIGYVHQVNEGKAELTEDSLNRLRDHLQLFTFDILGLMDEQNEGGDDLSEELLELLLEMRLEARKNRNYALSDQIRDKLESLGVRILDGKDGSRWEKIK